MPHTTTQNIILFIVLSTILILLLVCLIVFFVYRYQQKQNAYFKNLEEIRVAHDNILLQSQVEMQEMTFENISREIHDNIGQKLALAKLLLNTLPYNVIDKLQEQVESSVNILSEVVNELSNLSRSMSNEFVLENGIIKATETALTQIKKSDVYTTNFQYFGESVYMNINRELILFRVIQESLHNIIKHAEAKHIDVKLRYGVNTLALQIADNGKGFPISNDCHTGTGIKNMQKRIRLLNGSYIIDSKASMGTIIKIEIPYYDNDNFPQTNPRR